MERWKWHHLAVIRSGDSAYVYLDGKRDAGFSIELKKPKDSEPLLPDTLFFGGSCTGEGNFEGRLDEIAVFERALAEEEIRELHRAGTAP